MTDQVLRSVRLPSELMEWFQQRADEQDRSLNWQIKQALETFREQYDNPPKRVVQGAVLPKLPPKESGGLTSFQAIIEWYMPHYADDIESGFVGTETRCRDAMRDFAEILRGYGAQDIIRLRQLTHLAPGQFPDTAVFHPDGSVSYPIHPRQEFIKAVDHFRSDDPRSRSFGIEPGGPAIYRVPVEQVRVGDILCSASDEITVTGVGREQDTYMIRYTSAGEATGGTLERQEGEIVLVVAKSPGTAEVPGPARYLVMAHAVGKGDHLLVEGNEIVVKGTGLVDDKIVLIEFENPDGQIGGTLARAESEVVTRLYYGLGMDYSDGSPVCETAWENLAEPDEEDLGRTMTDR